MDRTSRQVAIAAVLIVAVLVIWMSRREREQRPQLDPPAVLVRVQQLSQLATVKYTVQKVVGLRDQKVPVGSESILLIMQANVEAGIDLSSMHSGDVTVRPDGAMVLQLPQPKILSIV